MKLSAAIRIGSMTSKQIRRTAWDGGNGYCAIGAALHALNIVPSFDEWACQLLVAFPGAEQCVFHPITVHYERLIDVIWKLNDIDEWTREAIADFVETVELKEVKHQEAVLHE